MPWRIRRVRSMSEIAVLSFGRDARLCFPGADRWALQPEIFAQRLSGIIPVKQSAPLQFRHHVLDEISIRAGHIICGDHEAIAAPPHKHLFQSVSDFFWSA